MTGLTSAAAGDAWRRWTGDRDTIVAIAGPFLFLPVFAWLLLITEPSAPADATRDEKSAIVLAWLAENLPWLALRIGIELFATLAILTLLLGREHRTVGDLLRRAFTMLPMFAVAVMTSWGLVASGVIMLIVPSFYIYGRVALTGPVMAAEPGVGFVGAIARSVALTHGNGWRTFALLSVPLMAGFLAVQVIGGIDHAMRAGGGNPVARAAVEAVAALIVTSSHLARILLQASLYRRLASPRHRV